jgi:hypothetical protein
MATMEQRRSCDRERIYGKTYGNNLSQMQEGFDAFSANIQRGSRITKTRKEGVKQAAWEFYQARRITLEMAIWAMKNAGYTREETIKALNLGKKSLERETKG